MSIGTWTGEVWEKVIPAKCLYTSLSALGKHSAIYPEKFV